MDTSFLREHSAAIMVVVAMIIACFSYAPMGLWIFAWIWPAILIYALRRLPLKQSIGIAIVAVMVPCLLSHMCALSGSESGSFPIWDYIGCAIIVLIVCLLNCLPFVADRLTYGKVTKYQQLFVLPLTWAIATLLCGLTPWGDMICIAYSQAGFMWFTQSLSLIGMTGMVIIIGWFATSVNLFISEYSMEEKISWPSTVCAIVIVALMIFGGVRVSTIDDSDTMTVMCANGHDNINDGKDSLNESMAQFDTIYAKAVDANVDMLVFSEESFDFSDKDPKPFYDHVATKVGECGIDVMIAMEDKRGNNVYNSSALVTENGVEWIYDKAKLIPLSDATHTPGNGTKYCSETEFGRITSVICMDLEFPLYVNSIDTKADILIAPSWDWEGLDHWHTRNTSFRAIENGVSFLRCTMNGTIGSYDHCGKLIQEENNFPKSPDEVHVVKVCTHGTETFYGKYGAAVEWTYVILSILLALWCAYPYVRDYAQKKD